MTTVLQRPLARTLFVGALAIVGTIGSFTATTTPALAQSARYTAVLATALEAPAKKVVNGAAWTCTGTSCTGSSDGSAPARTCARVVKAFGPVTSFATPKGELSADQLARCNGAA